jgi:hypothetical protein
MDASNSRALVGVSVVFGFLAWGVVTVRYLWPKLRTLPREEGLAALLTLHTFRFVGLAFLMPGVVRPDLPGAFARPAAYGDLIAAILALLALAILRTSWGTAVVWSFNILGSADLVYAFYNGFVAVRLPPGSLGAAIIIPTLIVPLLIMTHGLIFRLLVEARGDLRGEGRAP